MTRYELWLLFHVLAAVVWAGAVFALGITGISAERTRTPVELPVLARINAWVGPRIATPAAVVAFVAGVLLVVDGPWSWGDLWIVLGLAGFALTFLPGFFFLTPESKRIRDAVQREGPGSPEAAWRVRRVLLVSRVAIVLLFLVIADMVVKPTRDDGAVLAGGVVVLALLLAGVVALFRAAPRPPERS
jgi:uncharacterized membrane protein